MLSIIAVIGKNREIGYKNQLLWKLPKDMQRFQRITQGKTVIMGEKTFFSIGQPLKDRKNIVATLDKKFFASGVKIVTDLKTELKKWITIPEEAFIIGGGTIYQLALPLTQRLYLTKIDDAPPADTFFPEFSQFNKILYQETGKDNNLDYEFLILEK